MATWESRDGFGMGIPTATIGGSRFQHNNFKPLFKWSNQNAYYIFKGGKKLKD
jgi:hypothetical protein